MRYFLKPSWGDLDKELSEWEEGDQRQDLLPHQPTKREFFTRSCRQTNPLPHPSEQDPLSTQLR